MMNFLDLLVIIFMVLVVSSLLALSLMFLVRNERVKKICFYIVAVLGVYAASIGIRIGGSLFPVQTTIGIVVGLVSVAAIVMTLMRNRSEKTFKIAQAMAAVALVVGVINAFI